MTLPKRSKASAWATSAAVVVAAGAAACRSGVELVGVDRVAGAARAARRRRAARPPGRRGRGRGTSPTPARGGAGERRDVDRLDDAAEALRGQREQAVVGADEDPVLLGGAQRDRAALAADLGVDDREVHARRAVRQRAAQHERAGAHVVAGDAVGEVDDPRLGRDPRDDAVADADEVVVEAVVGQEGDDRCHRTARLSAGTVAEPGSASAMSDPRSTPDDAQRAAARRARGGAARRARGAAGGRGRARARRRTRCPASRPRASRPPRAERPA